MTTGEDFAGWAKEFHLYLVDVGYHRGIWKEKWLLWKRLVLYVRIVKRRTIFQILCNAAGKEN